MDATTLSDIYERLGKLEAKLEAVLDNTEELKLLEKRVDALESWRSYLTGAFAVAAVVISVFGSSMWTRLGETPEQLDPSPIDVEVPE